MVEWDGEVTLNFSVDIKRPGRDYDALRVARPFARMHMSLRTYIWTMNAGACRVFCPLFLVAHSCLRLCHTAVSSVYAYACRVFFRGGSVAPSGKETRVPTGDGGKKEKEKEKKENEKKIYSILMYDANVFARSTPSAHRLESRENEHAAVRVYGMLQPEMPPRPFYPDVELLSQR